MVKPRVTTDKHDKPIIANEKGEFTIELKDPLIDKQSVTATAKDKAHNISPFIRFNYCTLFQ